MKATWKGQVLALALLNKVVRTKRASRVDLPCLNPNCSSPSIPSASAIAVILLHILFVMILSMLEGMVRGLYCPGDNESPP